MGGGVGRGGGGMGNQGRAISNQEWEDLAANPSFLAIRQSEDQITVNDDSDHTRTLHPDGKKHQDLDANGKKITTKAQWEGDALVAEYKVGRSGKLTETYRLSSDGKELDVVSRFEDPSLNGPLSIRRVYDLEKPSATK